MDFELTPPLGVGPLRIGMPCPAAHRALESLRDEHDSAGDGRAAGRRFFRASGLMVSIGCTHDRLAHVELGRPSDPSDAVRFRGIDVFALPARTVVDRLAKITAVGPAGDDPASVVAPDLLLGFWRPFEADDDPDEEQGHYFNSVLLARPGYYDEPSAS
ncbi:hypothetical protein ACFYO9_32550 [Streptomyces sp. NPDC005863]|uniref:hypothetical protein n=1 Tax=unclassified Streptomyces TaxID=2593676 RepID=UPI003405DC31